MVAHFSCHALTHQHCELMPRISLRVGCSSRLVMLWDFNTRSISDDLTQRHGNTDTRYLHSTYDGCARTIAAERHGAPRAPSAVSRTQGLPLGCRSVAPSAPRETPEQKLARTVYNVRPSSYHSFACLINVTWNNLSRVRSS